MSGPPVHVVDELSVGSYCGGIEASDNVRQGLSPFTPHRGSKRKECVRDTE